MEEVKTTSGGSYFKKDQSVIHTMPKRYLNTAKISSKQAKSTGFLILVAGVVMLGAAFIFLYLYFSKPNEEVLVNENITPAEITNKTASVEKKTEEKTEEKSVASVKMDNLENREDPGLNPNINLPKTSTSSEIATSTEKTPSISTTTKKIVIEEKATTTPRVYITANDSDGDGLGDIEELLLDCNLGSLDSDGDGYDDLAELLSLYNPAGGGKIIVNPNIEKYVNQSYNYSLYYPNIWILKTVGGDESLLLQISTDQFVQVAVEANNLNKTIDEWYKEQFSVNYIKDEQRIIKEGWLGIKSEEGLVVYLIHPGDASIFSISYDPGVEGVMNYKNIFDMIVNSLEIND